MDAARPGDLILVDRGTYPGGVQVLEGKDGITIRGVDRNEVVFDGEGRRPNAIIVEADGVTLENLSAHDFPANGFYWEGVDGFAGRYLSVWNVGLSGIFAILSRGGVLEHSLVSGAADAAFHIAECNPCDTVLSDVTARLSAVGYSGTNAGGGLFVRDSVWERNGVGILPSSFWSGLARPPQRDAVFTGNVVRDSGTVPTPAHSPLGGFVGIGIGVLGGSGNVIEGNLVTGSARYGIAVFPAVDRETTWAPEGNLIRGNEARGSGVADLALAAGSGAANCFEGNDFGRALPAALGDAPCPAGGGPLGDPSVAEDLVVSPPEALARAPQLRGAPGYGSIPPPEPQPGLPGGAADAASPGGPAPALIAAMAAGGAALLAGAAARLSRRSRRRPGA